MRARSDSSLAALLLTNRLVDAGAKPLTSREFWALVEAVGDPAALLGAAGSQVADATGAGAEGGERVARLLDAGTALALELEELEQRGLRVLSPFDDEYPGRLRDRLAQAAPPILYVAGQTRLLREAGLGVVGSRTVGSVAEQVARQAAAQAAQHGLTLVSGGAKGVDQHAMDAAFHAGGPVVGVLADPLSRRLRDPATRRAIGDGRACLLTPYKPTAGFSVANAMGRNKLIYALSRLTLVVAADLETGGTWAGATEAARRGFGRVAVWTAEGGGPGNAALAAMDGTHAVHDLEDLFPVADLDPGEARVQLTLGL